MGCASRIRKGIHQGAKSPDLQINAVTKTTGRDDAGVDNYDGRNIASGDTPGSQNAEANEGTYFTTPKVIKTFGQ